MKRHTARTLSFVEEHSRILFVTLMGLVVALCAMYVYFLISTVANTAMRADAEKKVAAMNSRISEMEFNYINTKNAVTMDMAQTLGFVSSGTKTAFVVRGDAANVAIR